MLLGNSETASSDSEDSFFSLIQFFLDNICDILRFLIQKSSEGQVSRIDEFRFWFLTRFPYAPESVCDALKKIENYDPNVFNRCLKNLVRLRFRNAGRCILIDTLLDPAEVDAQRLMDYRYSRLARLQNPVLLPRSVFTYVRNGQTELDREIAEAEQIRNHVEHSDFPVTDQKIDTSWLTVVDDSDCSTEPTERKTPKVWIHRPSQKNRRKSPEAESDSSSLDDVTPSTPAAQAPKIPPLMAWEPIPALKTSTLDLVDFPPVSSSSRERSVVPTSLPSRMETSGGIAFTRKQTNRTSEPNEQEEVELEEDQSHSMIPLPRRNSVDQTLFLAPPPGLNIRPELLRPLVQIPPPNIEQTTSESGRLSSFSSSSSDSSVISWSTDTFSPPVYKSSSSANISSISRSYASTPRRDSPPRKKCLTANDFITLFQNLDPTIERLFPNKEFRPLSLEQEWTPWKTKDFVSVLKTSDK